MIASAVLLLLPLFRLLLARVRGKAVAPVPSAD
jgi:hypothetical protein